MVNPAQQVVRQTVLGLVVRMRRGSVCYIGGCDMLPAPLSREEEQESMRQMRAGDQAARARLIEHNLRLVVYIARRFDNTGIGIEDLISIGAIGLIKAVGSFNPEKNIKLATYASRCIENEILMVLRRHHTRQNPFHRRILHFFDRHCGFTCNTTGSGQSIQEKTKFR